MAKSIMDSARPVQEITRDRLWTFYGKPGTGKTTLAATFPRPVLLIDINDEGTDSIKDIADVDVIDIYNLDDLEQLLDELKHDPRDYRTVVIDTITQVQEMAVVEITRKRGIADTKAGSWGTMRQQDWGDVGARVKGYIQELRDLKPDVVVLAQERLNNADDRAADLDLDPEIGVGLSRGPANFLYSMSAVVGRVAKVAKVEKIVKGGKKRERTTVVHRVYIGPNEICVTKIRMPKSYEVPGHIDNCEYEDLEAVMEGEY
jgi:phage nucleotide-binding protein